MIATQKNILNILLIENNLADAELIEEVLKETTLLSRLEVVRDGEEAMEFLHKEGRYADAVQPDLIILDLNLPKKDGREVLEEVKADECLQKIPVVVLTTSKAEEDIIKCYRLQASCYITKPARLEQFINVVTSIGNFWLAVVTLPPE